MLQRPEPLYRLYSPCCSDRSCTCGGEGLSYEVVTEEEARERGIDVSELERHRPRVKP